MTKKRPLTQNEHRLWRYVTQNNFAPAQIQMPNVNSETPKKLSRAGQIDGQILKRLEQGKLQFSGRVDLHGLTLDQAYDRLSAYLHDIQALGGLYVLVITGKGKSASDYLPDDHRGELRQMVPRWLAAGPFAELVADVATAHAVHGGEGALYVRLKQNHVH